MGRNGTSRQADNLAAMRTRDRDAAAVNADFFATGQHACDSARLDTFQLIWAAIDREVRGVERLLDVGNGGVFGYDTSAVGEIVALDLFLDRLPPSRFPANVTPRRGNALDLDEPDAHYDAVLEALLYHHLVGAEPEDMVANVRRAIAEASRVLKPGGRLIVAESCVPRWFYAIEKPLYRPLVMLSRTRLLGGHPPTIQIPFELLVSLVGERLEVDSSYEIPPGRWTTQFGRRWPTALTPARAYMVVGRKPS
jgi:SAM-dependent methyltransferase